MIDAVNLTLIILVAVLLRRPLLTDPDAHPGVREEGKFFSTKTLIPATVRAQSPHRARSRRIKR